MCIGHFFIGCCVTMKINLCYIVKSVVILTLFIVYSFPVTEYSARLEYLLSKQIKILSSLKGKLIILIIFFNSQFIIIIISISDTIALLRMSEH